MNLPVRGARVNLIKPAYYDMTATVRRIDLSTWYSAATELDRPQLTFDLDVDVCVVGAGLAGLTVAREVARRGWSVAVVEAQRVAWNASGRNCGFVLPGFTAGIDPNHRAGRA